MALSYGLFGVSRVAAKLPALLGSLALVGTTWLLAREVGRPHGCAVRRATGRPAAGLRAGDDAQTLGALHRGDGLRPTGAARRHPPRFSATVARSGWLAATRLRPGRRFRLLPAPAGRLVPGPLRPARACSASAGCDWCRPPSAVCSASPSARCRCGSTTCRPAGRRSASSWPAAADRSADRGQVLTAWLNADLPRGAGSVGTLEQQPVAVERRTGRDPGRWRVVWAVVRAPGAAPPPARRRAAPAGDDTDRLRAQRLRRTRAQPVRFRRHRSVHAAHLERAGDRAGRVPGLALALAPGGRRPHSPPSSSARLPGSGMRSTPWRPSSRRTGSKLPVDSSPLLDALRADGVDAVWLNHWAGLPVMFDAARARPAADRLRLVRRPGRRDRPLPGVPRPACGPPPGPPSCSSPTSPTPSSKRASTRSA